MALLSVISITYNNLRGLEKTLEAFGGGAFAEIEVVIVDGSSSDGTKEFLEKQNITTNWVSEPDQGIYNAMNKGLAMARGEYVWFLNAGDYAYDLESVSAILEAIRPREIDALYGETMMADADGKALGIRSAISTRMLPDHLDWKSFSMGMNVSHQSFIIRRSLALPYNEAYRHVADIDWMIRCLKQCRNIQRLPNIISCFTVDGYSTRNRDASNKERYKVLAKHYGWLPNLWNHFRIALRKLGQGGKV